MQNIYKLSFIILVFIYFIPENVLSQEKLSEVRDGYFLTYEFGLADGQTSRELARNIHALNFGRSFAINNLMSLSPVLSYTKFTSNNFIKNDAVGLGGNISIYPKYIASLIFNSPYDAKKDKLFVDIGLLKTVNRIDHALVFNLDVHILPVLISDRLTISPNLGFQSFISSQTDIADLGFYTIGLKLFLK